MNENTTDNRVNAEESKPSRCCKTIKLVVVKPCSEKDKADTELKRVQKQTEWVKALAPWLTIVTIIFGILTYLKDFNYKEDIAYESAVALIWTGDLPAKQNALRVALRHADKHDDFAQRLLDFMYVQKQDILDAIRHDLIGTFMALGRRVPERLIRDNRIYVNGSEARKLAINQWAIIELLKANVTYQIPSLDFSRVVLDFRSERIVGLGLAKANFSSAKILNLYMDSGAFSEVDFSGAQFYDCVFWQARFHDTSMLIGTRFEKCQFVKAEFFSDLKETIFTADCIASDSCVASDQLKSANMPKGIKVGCGESK